MILHILSTLKKMGPEESCALLWREGRLNHTFCCMPFSSNILSTLMDKAGIAINSIKFWENSLSDHFGSLLEFQQKMMYDMFIEAQSDRDLTTNSSVTSVSLVELLKERVVALASNSQKTTQSTFITSNLLYTLSEKYRRHGKLSEGAITKRMTAIEEMDGMDVLCSDKTGTLTLNKLTVDKNLIEVFAKGIDKDTVVLMAARASRTKNRDSIDAAIVGILADPKEVCRHGMI
ncbi:hypothetical protein KI387_040769 [Taxus chinensis]|uniref:Uncharacterized protein n=1 Tax=Taxus chinensis TaxID=29808 RepID=A0AA38F9F9_TAXCH|nr:hypothetical protein KI387_040769 [Taxus chinensis]